MRNRRFAVSLLVASLMVVAFAFGAFAAEPEYTLRFAGSYAPDHPGTATQYAIAEEVAEKTDGKVKIEVYPASQLGDYVQVYEDVIRGSVDMGYFYITGQYNQMLEICSMPYLTTSWEGLKDVFSPGSFWYETYEEAHAKVGVQLLGVYVDSFISLATVKEPADPFDPEANHEILVRIPPSELYKVTMKDLNYDTVTINWSDLYTAMQTGVCDGYIGGTASLNYFTFRDLIKNFFPVRMFVENVSYIMNKDLFEEMPEEYSRIILEACQKQASKSIVEARKQEEKYQRKLAEEHDVVIHDVSQEEIDALAAHVRKVSWPKFSKMFGEEVIEGLLEDVQQ